MQGSVCVSVCPWVRRIPSAKFTCPYLGISDSRGDSRGDIPVVLIRKFGGTE
jgi:hypothetical protein